MSNVEDAGGGSVEQIVFEERVLACATGQMVGLKKVYFLVLGGTRN
jgi:hypothetical protein